MATSAVTISNMALSRIGARSTIASLTEDSNEARHCKLLFDHARDATLEAFDWNFARVRVALAELGDEPTGWSYRYAYPSNCIQPRFLEAPTRTERRLPYRIEAKADLSGRVILTDVEDAVLVYTARVTDPALFTPSFVTALSWRLGADLAIPITGKESLQQRCLAMWQNTLNSAAVNDANAEAPDEIPDASWISARD
jgi:hypothetical protein